MQFTLFHNDIMFHKTARKNKNKCDWKNNIVFTNKIGFYVKSLNSIVLYILKI